MLFNEYIEFEKDGEIVDVYINDEREEVKVWGDGFVKKFNTDKKRFCFRYLRA